MLVYTNTFENIKTKGINFPVEDQYYANDNEAIVADGITRDPIGISDFSKTTKREFLEKYPRPSGAELAAKEICSTFPETGYFQRYIPSADPATLPRKDTQPCTPQDRRR